MFDINQPRPFLRPAAPAAPAARPAGPRPDGVHKVRAYIVGVLDGQQALEPEDRNDELINALLDVRNLLTVPVVPGRSS